MHSPGMAAAFDEHTEEVLGSPGFNAGDKAELRERKVI